MPETTATQPAPLPTVADALRNPTLLVSRRGELLQLATVRAARLTADARARLEKSRLGAIAAAQDLRKASDALAADALGRIGRSRAAASARVRTTAHDQLQRAASALQELAKRIEPSRQAPEETPPAGGAA